MVIRFENGFKIIELNGINNKYKTTYNFASSGQPSLYLNALISKDRALIFESKKASLAAK